MSGTQQAMANAFVAMIGALVGVVLGGMLGYAVAGNWLPAPPDARPEDYLQQWPYLMQVIWIRGWGISTGSLAGALAGGACGYFLNLRWAKRSAQAVDG